MTEMFSLISEGLDSCEIYGSLASHPKTSKIFLDVFSWDTIPIHIKSKKFSFICNLSKAEHTGTHWIAIYSDGSYMDIFDSYCAIKNRVTTSRLKKLSNNMNLPIRYNRKRLQSDISNVCGHYCIAFIILRSKNYTIRQISSLFSSNFEKNDHHIRKYVTPFIYSSKKKRNFCYKR